MARLICFRCSRRVSMLIWLTVEEMTVLGWRDVPWRWHWDVAVGIR